MRKAFLTGLISFAFLISFFTSAIQAAVLTWDGNTSTAGLQDGGGIWDLTAINRWWNGTAYQAWTNTDSAVFGVGSGSAGTITLASGGITANDITFNAAGSGTYTITSSNTLTVTSGITANASATINAPTTLGATNTWSIASGKTLTVNGVFSAVSGRNLHKTGNGVLLLNAANTGFNGEIYVDAGTLKVGNNSSLGSATYGTFIASGATLDLNDKNIANEVIHVQGAGVGGNGAIVNFGSGVYQAVSALVLDNDATIGGTARWDVYGSGAYIDLAGHTLTKQGTNPIYVPNCSVNSGNININNGLLSFENGAVVGGTGIITVNGSGILSVGEWGAPINLTKAITLNGGMLQSEWDGSGTCSVASNITLAANSTIDTVTSTNLTLTGAVSGTNQLTKNSSGNLILTANSSYSGGTVISGGILANGADYAGNQKTNALGTGSITINNGGQLRFGGQSGDIVHYYTPNAITVNNGTIFGNDGVQHLQGNITVNGPCLLETNWATKDIYVEGTVSGSGAMSIMSLGGNGSPGIVRFTQANPYSGTMTIQPGSGGDGGLVSVGNNNALANATVAMNGTHGMLFTVTTPSFGALSGNGNFTLPTSSLTVGGNNASTTYSGSMSGGGGLIKTGSGIFELTGSNSYSGTTTINAGTLSISASNNLSASSLVFGGGTLRITGASAYVNSRSVSFNTTGIIQQENTAGATFSGVLGGTGGLTKTGSGVLNLANANTFTGDTRLVAGTLLLQNAQALKNSTVDLASSDAGILNLNNLDVTFGGLKGSRNLYVPTGHAITIGNNNTDTEYSGTLLGDSFNISKIGTGKLTFAGSQLCPGSLTVNQGILQANNNLTINEGLRTYNSGTQLHILGNYSQAGTDGMWISGGSTLQIDGTFTKASTGEFVVENSTLLVGDFSSGSVAAGGGRVTQGAKADIGSLHVSVGGFSVADVGSALHIHGNYLQDGTDNGLWIHGGSTFQTDGTFTKTSIGEFVVENSTLTVGDFSSGSVAAGGGRVTLGAKADIGSLHVSVGSFSVADANTTLHIHGAYLQDGTDNGLRIHGGSTFQVDGTFTKTSIGEFVVVNSTLTIGDFSSGSVAAGGGGVTQGAKADIGPLHILGGFSVDDVGTILHIHGDYLQDGTGNGLWIRGGSTFQTDGTFTANLTGELVVEGSTLTVGSFSSGSVAAWEVRVSQGSQVNIGPLSVRNHLDVIGSGSVLHIQGNYLQEGGGNFYVNTGGSFQTNGTFTKTSGGNFWIDGGTFNVGDLSSGSVAAWEVRVTQGSQVHIGPLSVRNHLDVIGSGSVLHIQGNYLQEGGGNFYVNTGGSFQTNGTFTKTSGGNFWIDGGTFNVGDLSSGSVAAWEVRVTQGSQVHIGPLSVRNHLDVIGSGSVLHIQGNYLQEGGGNFYVNTGGSFQTNGTFTKTSGGNFWIDGGTFNVGDLSSGSVAAWEVRVSQGSQVNIGPLSVQNHLDVIGSGSVLHIQGNYLHEGNGNFHVNSGGSLQTDGILTKSSTGDFRVEGGTVIAGDLSAGIINANYACISGNSIVTVANMEILGEIVIEDNSILTVKSLLADTLTIGSTNTADSISHSSSLVKNNPANAVPEPSTLLLLGLSCLGIIGFRWNRRTKM